jgi:hypothetical protein
MELKMKWKGIDCIYKLKSVSAYLEEPTVEKFFPEYKLCFKVTEEFTGIYLFDYVIKLNSGEAALVCDGVFFSEPKVYTLLEGKLNNLL